ncbi:MAG: endonuclease/exonuclease/phosphatase family protein [Alistipes sp.]|nr:endonuclease/exonuclease/phosphatase family protein [Alistipes sp.]
MRLTGKLLTLLPLAAMMACGGAVNTDDTIKAISYNIRYDNPRDGENSWDNRREATLQMLATEDPDLVGMQEVLYSQFLFLEENAPQYGIVGVGRDDGYRGGEMMAVMYKKERFDKTDEGHFWLSETPDEVSLGWDGACNRMVTWLSLHDKATDRDLYFFNTHLDHIGPDARTQGSNLVAEKIIAITGGAPFILTGDFNADPSDPVLDGLNGSFPSARDNAPSTDRRATFNGFGKDGGTVIDHIYYRGFEPMVFRTLDGDYGAPYISDHYPVEAVFSYDAR